MKIKEGFLLREIVGETVVVPSGDAMDLDMMITLNETGRFPWQQLEKGAEQEELVQALLKEYDVDEPTARTHTEAFIQKMKNHGFLA